MLLVASTVLSKLIDPDTDKLTVDKLLIPVISSFKLDNTNLLKPLAILTIGWLIVELYKISPPKFCKVLIELFGKFFYQIA